MGRSPSPRRRRPSSSSSSRRDYGYNPRPGSGRVYSTYFSSLPPSSYMPFPNSKRVFQTLNSIVEMGEEREPSDEMKRRFEELDAAALAQIQVQDDTEGGRTYKYTPGEAGSGSGGSSLVPTDGGRSRPPGGKTPVKDTTSEWNQELEAHRAHFRECIQPPDPTDKTFDEIIGYDKAKATLRTLLLPLKQPQSIDPKRVKSAVMMFGPPGTGKTTLAKALANEGGITFMNVGIQDLKTKWKGDAEKLIAEMFFVAQEVRPCVLFIDEIDGLIQEHSEDNKDRDHGAGQKSVLHSIMTDLGPGKKYHSIYVITNTNSPWNLPEAFRSRNAKRMFIDLPNEATRKAMFLGDKYYRAVAKTHPNLIDDFVRRTPMYSGRDIENVMTSSYDEKSDIVTMAQFFVWKWSEVDREKRYFPCGPNTPGARKMNSSQVPTGLLYSIEPTIKSMKAAFDLTKPILTKAKLQKYRDWSAKDGFDGGKEVEVKDDWFENDDPEDQRIILLPEDGGPSYDRSRRGPGGGGGRRGDGHGERGRSGLPSYRRSASYRPLSPQRPDYRRSKTLPLPPPYSSPYSSAPPSLVSSSGYSDSLASDRSSRAGSRRASLPTPPQYYSLPPADSYGKDSYSKKAYASEPKYLSEYDYRPKADRAASSRLYSSSSSAPKDSREYYKRSSSRQNPSYYDLPPLDYAKYERRG